MHRSGTSLFANWMNKCGLEMGQESLIPADFWNKNGHYEDKTIVEFHSSIIKSSFRKSRGWIVTNDEFINFNSQQKCQADNIINELEMAV
jgi:hypothetical protein